MTNWNLSDKIDPNSQHFSKDVLTIKDVKEFIKRLKEDLLLPFQEENWQGVKEIIDELAGEKLV